MINRLKQKYMSLSPKMVATVWFIICAFLQKAISVIFTPIFTRIMSTQEYGQFSVYSSWADVLSIIFTLKLAQGVYTQGIIKFDGIKDKFSSAIQGLTLFLVSFWFFIYISFHEFWNPLLGLTTLQMLALFIKVWADEVFQIWAKKERAEYRYKQLVSIIIADALIRPILGVILVLHATDKVTVRVWEMALVDFFLYIGLFFYQIDKGRTFFSRKIWGYALNFNIPLIPHYLSQVVLNSSDRIMIGKIVNSESAGIYSLAYSISLLLNLFINAFSHAMSPWTFLQLKNNNTDRIRKVGESAVIFLGLLDILFILFVPEIVSIFAPIQYHEAIWIIPPIAISLIYQFSYYLFTDIELYSENTSITALATMTGAGANLILNFFYIQRYGYFAAAYTTLVCYVFIAVLHYIAMFKVCKNVFSISPIYDWKRIMFICIIFTVATFVIMGTFEYLLIRCVMFSMIVGLLYYKRNSIIGTLNDIGVFKSRT